MNDGYEFALALVSDGLTWYNQTIWEPQYMIYLTGDSQLASDDSLYIFPFTECLIFARVSVILEMNGKHEQAIIAFSVAYIVDLIYFIRTFNATTRLIKFKMCEKLLYVLLLIAILQVWEEVFIWPYPLFQIMYILNTNHVQILQVLPSISSYW